MKYKQRSKTTDVQSLLFDRSRYNIPAAKGWAKRHGYKYGDVDATDDYVHLRQRQPEEFQKGTFRTIVFGHGINAVVGRPWVKIIDNPHPKPDHDARVLFHAINTDWTLHRAKHALYGRLAKARAAGRKPLLRVFRPLVKRAAKTYARWERIKAPLRKVFSETTYAGAERKLLEQFEREWKDGQLDQYIPRKVWYKRPKK